MELLVVDSCYIMEVFLVPTGEVHSRPQAQLQLAVLRDQLSCATLLVITQDSQVLTQPDALLPLGSHIALIPNNSQVLDPVPSAWDSMSFPPGQSYLSPFDFDAYEDFQGKYRRLPSIEKQLFHLQSTAYETWARYITQETHFKSVCRAIEKRTEACGLLVQVSLRGLKDVKQKLKSALHRTETICDKQATALIQEISSTVQVKLLSMKTVLNKMKSQITGAQKYAVNRGSMLSKRVASLLESVCLNKGDEVGSVFGSIRDRYTQFRSVFEEILDAKKEVPNRSQKAAALLALEEQLPVLTKLLEPVQQHLVNLESLLPTLTKESDTSRQTMRQTLHSLALGVKVVRIKVESRLLKWSKVITELESKRQLTTISALPEEFKREKEAELDRQREVVERIKESVEVLKSKIETEKTAREEFVRGTGALLPAVLMPELNLKPISASRKWVSEAFQLTSTRLFSEIREKEEKVTELAYQIHQTKRLNEALQKAGGNYTLELEGCVSAVVSEQRGQLNRYSSFA